MRRSQAVLPFFTAALPFLAGGLPLLHGTLAGLLAIASPLLVDIPCSLLLGETKWRAGDVQPPTPRRYFSVLLGLYALGYALFFSRFVLTSASLPLLDVVGGGFTWVVLSGVPTLIVGHALIHARSRLSRATGQALFSLMNYPAFPRVHVEGHHRHVATEADAHSASRDETFYRFFVRSLAEELTSLPKPGQRGHAALLFALQAAIVIVVGVVAGPRGLLVYAVTTFLSRGVVALVNYVQHYGLERAPRQKVGIDHAWDLPFKSANWLYFNAGFHADHHMKASVDPGALVYRSTAFILPYNIPIILPMALVPPLFFRVMNPILAAQGCASSRRADVTSDSRLLAHERRCP